MTHGETMETERSVLVELPIDIIERVLSLVSVPAMCRMRAVCKAWNEITYRPSFLDLCEVDGRNDEFLFMWMEVSRYDPERVVVNPIFSDTLSFLDVDAKRWYSIPVADGPRVCSCGHKVESRFLAMSDGLVCELTTVKDCTYEIFALAISDPVAKTRKTLPAPPAAVFVAPFESHVVESLIVTAVDGATHSYKVFLLNNLTLPFFPPLHLPRVYTHESFTDEWQVMGNLPDGVEGEWASSAVVLQDSLFVLKQDAEYKLQLFRYRFREDTWAAVYEMCFPRLFHCNADLAVSGTRLFLSVWLAGGRSSDPECNPQFSDPGLASDPDCPHPVPFSEDPNLPDTCFEMFEVLVAESRRKVMVQLTYAQLQQIFGLEKVNVRSAIPRVGSDGICRSVVLAHATTDMGFELRRTAPQGDHRDLHGMEDFVMIDNASYITADDSKGVTRNHILRMRHLPWTLESLATYFQLLLYDVLFCDGVFAYQELGGMRSSTDCDTVLKPLTQGKTVNYHRSDPTRLQLFLLVEFVTRFSEVAFIVSVGEVCSTCS